MNLTVRRSGGFAGLRRTGEIEVPDAVGERLATLHRGDPQPDRYVYELTLGEQTVTVAEQDLPDDLRALVDRALG